MHTWFGNDVSGINDEDLNAYAADPGSDIQARTQSSQHPKERVHGHRRDIKNEKVDEELSRRPRHIRHKVYNEVETSDLDKHNRNIRRKLRKRICRRPIKRKRLVFE